MREIFATIAMPLYNMGKIADLAMESLINQKTTYDWELIVCEETFGDFYGETAIMEKSKLLENAGCKKITYIPISEWVPLGLKWHMISKKASDTECFILQAGDCYAHDLRIQNTCKSFDEKKCNYYDQQKGYFYSYKFNKTILFDPGDGYQHNCRLNMAYTTSLMKRLPINDRKRLVDSFLYSTLSKIEKINPFRDYSLYENGVDVDGYNNISSRDKFFNEDNHIFKPTDVDIMETLPILKRFKDLELTKTKIT